MTNTTIHEKYISIEELADFLSVSVSTIRNWIRNGIITSNDFLKICNTYRFKPSEIELALRRNLLNGHEGFNSGESSIDASENSIEEQEIVLPMVVSSTQELAGAFSIETINENEIERLYEIYKDTLQTVTDREVEIWRLVVEDGYDWKMVAQKIDLSSLWAEVLFARTCSKLQHPSRMNSFRNKVESVLYGKSNYLILAEELAVQLRAKDKGLYYFYTKIYGGREARNF